LINSAKSDVPKGTKEWLKRYLPKNERNIVFTHVPFDTQPIRRFIMDTDPRKNMTKYVQSHAPDLFDEQIQQQVDFVFTGHLHFTGLIKEAKTEHHFIGMGITPVNHNKGYTARCYMVNIDDKIEYRVVE